jgi:hypothetical protein
LAKSLSADLSEISKLFQEKGLGDIAAFLTEQTGTDGIKKMVQEHLDAINQVTYSEQTGLANLDPKDAAGRKKVEDEAQVTRLRAIKNAVVDVTREYNRLHAASVVDMALEQNEGLGAIQGHDPHQSDAAMSILGTTGHKLQAMYNQAVLQAQAAGLTGQVDEAEIHGKAEEARARARAQASEAAKKAQEALRADAAERFKILEEAFKDQEEAYNKHALKTGAPMQGPDEKGAWWKSQMYRGPNLGDLINPMIHEKIQDFDLSAISSEAEENNKLKETISKLNEENFEKTFKGFREQQEAQKKIAREAYDARKEDLEQQEKMAELLIKIEEANGKLSANQAARQLQALHNTTDAAYSQAFGVAQEAGAGYDLKEGEQLVGKAQYQQAQDKLIVYTTSFQGHVTDALDDVVKRSEDFATQFKEIFDSSLNSVNDAILKTLTDHNDPHPFRAAGHAIFSGVAKTGLQDAEGSLLKLLPHFGGGKAQHVIVDNMPKGSGGGAGAEGGARSVQGGLLNWANNNNWLGKHFGNLFGPGGKFDKNGTGALPDGSTGPGQRNSLSEQRPGVPGWVGWADQAAQLTAKLGLSAAAGSSGSGNSSSISNGATPYVRQSDDDLVPGGFNVLDYLPGYAGGGLPGPGSYAWVGEQGPELVRFGSTSRVFPHAESQAMASGGGSSSTTHHWHIDARGASDPAAINAAVQRGIMQAAPHLIVAANMAHEEHIRRTPGRH